MSMNVGPQNSLVSTSMINPASMSSSQRLTMGLSSTLAGSRHRSTETGSSAQVDELMKRAYVSPIKVRRLRRNPQDMETRLKLQKLSRRLGEKPSRSLDEEFPFVTAHESPDQTRVKKDLLRKHGRRDHPYVLHPGTDQFGQK
jgi:hypothetical protein